MQINGFTKIVGLFGDPVDHTLSPVMHNAAFRDLKINYAYLPFHVKKKELHQALKSLNALGIVGVNLTIPHKVEALKFVDKLDKQAKLIGAVNTIKLDSEKIKGYNTDGLGFIEALRRECKFVPKQKNVLVLGAGGAARAICVSLALNKVKKIIIANRTYGKAKDLAQYIGKRIKCKISYISLDEKELAKIACDIDLVVNCTSVGLNDIHARILKNSFFKKALNLKLVYDLIYSKKQTELIRNARKFGIKAFDGMSMLVCQGVLSSEIWTGIKPKLKIMKRALQNK